jgi:hypothetical protein
MKAAYLVGLVLEVAVPELVELGTHFLELLLGWADLEAGVDRVGREARFLGADLPLLEDLLTGLWVAAHEVVDRETLLVYAEDCMARSKRAIEISRHDVLESVV